MSFNDPIAELLTKIRNATRAQRRFCDISVSKLKKEVVNVLKQQGFIDNFIVNDQKKKMRIFLKYQQRKAVISDLKRVSSPGLRQYSSYQDIPRVRNGLGIAILSTPKGVLEGEEARSQKLGGELLCYVW